MNRRTFLASASATLLMPSLLGCPRQDQISQLLDVLGTNAANVAKLIGNTALAQQITTYSSMAVSAVKDWKNGSPVDQAIQALSALEPVLNVIPATSPYAPLIDICIATVQSILAMLPPPTHPSTQMTVVHARVVHLGHPIPQNAKEFRKQWNDVIRQHPELIDAYAK